MTDLEAGRDHRLGELPRAVPYDPALTASAPVPGDPATVVLLLAGGTDREWAAAAAVALSGAWARDGRRVVLADLHLENPILHQATGNRNLEGVVDVFLYGASIARSARPVSGQRFFLIPAGTYESDAEAIFHHPRWPKIVAGFRDASATLVLFAPAGSADVAALAEWVDQVILLGDAGSGAALGTLASRGVEPTVRLVPPGGALAADVKLERGSLSGARSDMPAGAPVMDREMTVPPTPRRRRATARRGLYTVLTLLAAAAILALAGYLLARYRPDLVPWAPAVAAPAGERAEVDPSAPSRTGDPLPYSVQVKAFTSLAAASEHAHEARASFDQQPFYVSPEEIQGILYYKVLAGLVADTAEAKRLRAELVDAGSVQEEEAVGSWSLIQFTPLAFDVGEYATDVAAAARADSLAEREIPSYRVAVPYSDGSRRWQLYAGAYRDSLSADAMRQRLVAGGIEPRLVVRIGELAGAPR